MQQDAGGSAAFTEKLLYLILNEANEATYTTFTTLSVYVMLKFDMKDRCCNLLTELQTTMQTSNHWAWVSVIRSLLALNEDYTVESFGLKTGLRTSFSRKDTSRC